MKKYTIDDLIVQDIIFIGNYAQAEAIVQELKKRNINTTVFDEMISIVDPKFRMAIENCGLVLYLNDNDVEMSKDKYLVIKCDDIDIEYQESDNDKQKEKQHKEFILNEVVHAIIPNEETFNPFAKTENVTAIISAVDRKNEMCEIVYLHQKHKTLWVRNENIFHIEHTYDEVAIDECFEEIEQ